LNEKFNDEVNSIGLFVYDPNHFQMIFASDPQFGWAKCSYGSSAINDPGDCYKLSNNADWDACQRDGGETCNPIEEEVNTFTNTRHVQSMNKLKQNADNANVRLAGVIMNGDLTNWGHDPELDDYKEYYDEMLNVPVYPGLGNHDYRNNVDDCGWGPTWNDCAGDMVDYMKDRMLTFPLTDLDVVDFWSDDVKGSLSYSFEIGPIVFVQMHNFPTYRTTFEVGGAFYDTIQITPSTSSLNGREPFLTRVLKKAKADRKWVVLNYHDKGISTSQFESYGET
jgi:cytolysin (calcineurin-like family phosphatase)